MFVSVKKFPQHVRSNLCQRVLKSTRLFYPQIKQFRPIARDLKFTWLYYVYVLSPNKTKQLDQWLYYVYVLSPDKTIHNIHYTPFVYRCPAEKITPIDARPVVQIYVI